MMVVLMNSIYGYAGFPGSRLYKKEVAFAITHVGQLLIKWSADQMSKHGYKIVYGDTDSILIQSKKSTKTGISDFNTSCSKFS